MKNLEIYNRIIKSNSGVLELIGEPGMAKTAVLESIAKRNNWYYKDIRLAQKDEGEVAGFPTLSDDKKTFYFAIPLWARQVCDAAAGKEVDGKTYDGALVVFEELNRVNRNVRNAALQVLNERRLGEDLVFPQNVFMAATGNLGEEDGTEVEEFDTALINRLVTRRHTLTVKDWVDDFAGKNVHPMLVQFLIANPGKFYAPTKKQGEKFATARSWTNLSKYITNTYGMDSSPNQWIADIKEFGSSYVGNSIVAFMRYVEEQMTININDILDNYEGKKEMIKKMNRSRRAELLSNLNAIEVSKMKPKQLKNVEQFFDDCLTDDEKIPFLKTLLSDTANVERKDTRAFLNHFKPVLIKIRDANEKEK